MTLPDEIRAGEAATPVDRTEGVGHPARTPGALLALIAAVAIAGPALIVANAPRVAVHRQARHAAPRVVPSAELPPVEPVAFEDLPPQDARDFNATVPFSTGPNPAARPFLLPGDAEQRARATDCMAAAVLYEAGDDPEGQRAVAQVVINRVRHPAFPKTICGVVFQGSERPTGCQFTFTCDGALANHRWSAAAWARARTAATAALSGSVYKKIGYATHYHTDWVVPYWQSSLDKVAAVHTHLFFRWTGWWGTPAAFNRHVSSDEPAVAQLAMYSDAHRSGAVAAGEIGTPANDAMLPVTMTSAAPLQTAPDSFLLTLDPHAPSDSYAQLATGACGERAYCKVMGWTDPRKLPTSLPLQPIQIAAMSFSYLRDRAHSYDKPLWNCRQFKRANPAECMKQQLLISPSSVANSAAPELLPAAVKAGMPAKGVPDGLIGVRRKVELTAVPVKGRDAFPAASAAKPPPVKMTPPALETRPQARATPAARSAAP